MHEKHRERMRQRFLKESLSSFEPHEVLELLLFYGIARKNTNDIAHELLKTFGSLSAVFNASYSELIKVKGVGDISATLITLIPQLSQRYLNDLKGSKPAITNSSDAGEYAVSLFHGVSYESFYVICLNKQRKIIFTELICKGTLDEVSVYPRIIIEAVMRHKAHSVILAHNHPGGGLQPSANDINCTAKIVDVLEAMDVLVVDHIIVADGKYTSFSDRGIMPK